MTVKADVTLDAKGLACPMPIVKTKKAMNDLQEGQIFEVQATDKGSTADLSSLVRNCWSPIYWYTEDGDVLYHYIRKCIRMTPDRKNT